MLECTCGYTCGTASALQRHLERTGHQRLEPHFTGTPSLPSHAKSRCVHIGDHCGCSKFQILGVPRAVSEAELRDAMRKHSLEWHPDRTLTEKWAATHAGVTPAVAAEQYKKLRSAYEALLPLIASRGPSSAAAPPPLIEAAKAGDTARIRQLLSAMEMDSASMRAVDDGGARQRDPGGRAADRRGAGRVRRTARGVALAGCACCMAFLEDGRGPVHEFT